MLKLQFPSSHILSLFSGFMQVSLILARAGLFEIPLFLGTESLTKNSSDRLFHRRVALRAACHAQRRPATTSVHFLNALLVVSVTFVLPPALPTSPNASMCSPYLTARSSSAATGRLISKTNTDTQSPRSGD